MEEGITGPRLWKSTSTTMAPQISVIFVLGRFSLSSPAGCIEPQESKLPPTGPPGAGKSTLSALLTENFPVQHISVGELLRRIKNDTTHPQAGAVASMLNKQELIDAKVLVPILRNELEESVSREQGRRVILVDGFPRNSAQRREFEKAVKHVSRASSQRLIVYVRPHVLTQQAVRRTLTRSTLQLP